MKRGDMNEGLNDANATQALTATIEAVVIRADGTREDLGVIASSANGNVTIEEKD
jgi:hypothetical protein